MRAKELVFAGDLADRNGNDSDCACAFHSGKVAPQRAEFPLLFVKLFLGHKLEFRFLRVVGHYVNSL